MVEILAHELWRTTRHALETLSIMERDSEDGASPAAIRTLEAQLRTLQKRLQILDPVNTATRQVKHSFVLYEMVRDVVVSHSGQFNRHGIKVNIHVEPNNAAKTFEVRMVPGMVVQVLENLINNSVYWLKQRKLLDSNFQPEIKITIDVKRRVVLIEDNGPGVDPARKEEIFGPFVTTKPPGEGKGLGLYISREIAKYHGGKLFLAENDNQTSKKLHTFVLSLPK
jgi:signal transduction histidine kinase